MGRDTEYPLTPDLEANLARLLIALNKFRSAYGKPLIVSSGYRPSRFNTAAHGAPNSNHLSCKACDFHDTDGSIDEWCLVNLHVLEECGLWLEDPGNTPGWIHLDISPRNSRVFFP